MIETQFAKTVASHKSALQGIDDLLVYLKEKIQALQLKKAEGAVTLKLKRCNANDGEGCVGCPHPSWGSVRFTRPRKATHVPFPYVISIKQPLKSTKVRSDKELMAHVKLAIDLIETRTKILKKQKELSIIATAAKKKIERILAE